MKQTVKRLLALLLTALMLVSLAACQTDKPTEPSKQEETTLAPTEKPTEKPDDETTAEPTEPEGVQFPLAEEVTLTFMVANMDGRDIPAELEKMEFWQ